MVTRDICLKATIKNTLITMSITSDLAIIYCLLFPNDTGPSNGLCLPTTKTLYVCKCRNVSAYYRISISSLSFAKFYLQNNFAPFVAIAFKNIYKI